jgi:hypothetical protein
MARATHLLDEEVANLLEQHCEPPWGAVALASSPNQTDHVEQRPQPGLHLRKFQVLQGVQVVVEW